uniref:Uncharacterized protein n=1 Tax=Anguilla anguilla TaxID=7936 RepID=A0A0E9S663_ANGAN
MVIYIELGYTVNIPQQSIGYLLL